jgi:hypothetical protein
MTTRDYWDLSEKERANLTREQVEGFAAFELMRLGVLAVAPLVLEEEPNVALPERKPYFRPSTSDKRYHSRNAWDVAFETQEQAAAFLALKPFHVHSHWTGNDSVACASPWPVDGGEIQVEQLPAEEAVAACAEQYRQLSSVRERNRKAREEHDKASREKNEALAAMWSDWDQQRANQARLQRVISTWSEYQRLAGDDATARRFLAKVYEASAVREAAEWFGTEIPELDAQFTEAEPPARVSTIHSPSAEELAF